MGRSNTETDRLEQVNNFYSEEHEEIEAEHVTCSIILFQLIIFLLTKKSLKNNAFNSSLKGIKGLRSPTVQFCGTYLASKTKAYIPATIGAAAEVPACFAQHPLRISVVNCTYHKITVAKGTKT